MMNLGGRVKQRRNQLGWSQEELAQKSGIGQGTISKMERTDQESTTFIVELAQALGVSATWLRTGVNEKSSRNSSKISEPNGKYELNEKTIRLVEAYKNAPAELQDAVARVLGIKD